MGASEEPGRIGAATTGGAGAVMILTAGAQEFDRYLTELLDSDTLEGPHKSRVALRRLRAAMIAFQPIMAPKLAKKLTKRLKSAFRDIGKVRDADVLARDCEDHALERKAEKIRGKIRKHLLRDDADDLARDIGRCLAGKDWCAATREARDLRRAPLASLATPALDDQWAALLAKGADLTALSPTERHDLRKRLKTFRYLAEYFAPLWPGAGIEAFLDELGALQDDLGRLNDLRMARARGLAVDDNGEPATLARARAAWARLSCTPPWWQGQ